MPAQMDCPECKKMITPQKWGGDDWRYACQECGFTMTINESNMEQEEKYNG